MYTPMQLQIINLVEGTPTEVQEAIKTFKEGSQTVEIEEMDAIFDFLNVKQPRVGLTQLATKADNKMYMNLLTEALVSGSSDDFAYYSRFYIQHLYWNVVRLPNKNGFSIFEEKDIDDRLKQMEFHVETDQDKQTFRAFLEFLQRESQFYGIFKEIHNSDKMADEQDQEEL